jgi:ParB/RepB/Spo0J family partition protein
MGNQTIEEVDIHSIQQDKNQPRQTIDPVKVHEMSKSIITEGVINPIEVDSSNVIITGEMRWRAAIEAGFKTIPVKRLSIKDDDRFRRQTIENLHHNTMTPYDTAVAIVKLLEIRGYKLEDIRRGVQKDDIVAELGSEIGKSKSWIYDSLRMLKQSKTVTGYLKKPDAKPSLIREIDRYAPEEVKEELKEKVVTGEIDNRDIAYQVAKAIKNHPELKDDLMSKDYTGLSTVDGIIAINAITKDIEEKEPEENVKDGSQILVMIVKLMKMLAEIHPLDILEMDRERIKRLTPEFVELLKSFNLRGSDDVIKGTEVKSLKKEE